VSSVAPGDRRADLAVVGAGILGLATARSLSLRHPRLRVVVIDKERELAAHQTGRSSGVIHSGLYYAPGSLKARLCTTSAAKLYRYCEERGIPTVRCGKVVVATREEELPRLEELHRRGLANGVPGLELIGGERLRELEPHAAGIRALHCPSTGIVDFRLVAAAYARDVEDAGGEILLGHELTAVVRRGGNVLLRTSGGDVEARYAIACAGVHADRVARLVGGSVEPRIVPFRGDYWVLRPGARHLANALLYPVPDPSFPFLGIHTTPRMDGSMWLGPNAVLAFAREGYGRYDVRLRDLRDTLAAPGFRRMARRHWRMGTAELAGDYSRRLFVRAARKLLPELRASDVVPGPAGIRAQALSPDGRLVDDFVVAVEGGVLHVRNAPSPGATSSLGIGETIADLAADAFGL
jgi:(S)-2-hydroxyglutarate dehydrogenase